MSYLNLYLELMEDLRFAVLSSSLFASVLVFFGLISMLGKKKSGPSVEMAGGAGAAGTTPAVDASMTWGGAPEKSKKPPPPAPLPAARPPDMEKTMVIAPPAVSVEAGVPPVPPTAPMVDSAMLETLGRRLSVLEAEQRKEPIFLDPLIKRLSALEKKADELTHKVNQPPPPAPAPVAPVEGGGALPEGFNDEFLALKEKVYGLQKILEHLAEGPVPPAP